ncbi:MAG: AAA family ATPase [Burkholderiaceae bacterium]|nr:AAA family ATPase [Burkholderiaceae bacterium]
MAARTLAPHELISRCDPDSLDLGDLEALAGTASIVGQRRAVEALEFGVAMRHAGHHLFVMGPPGTGRRTLVRQAIAAQMKADGGTRSDWVYVNNFAQPHKPLALELPAGRGAQLKADMQALVRDLRTMIPGMFESEEYATEVERINADLKERADQAFGSVAREAQQRGLALVRTPMGITVTPQKDGEVMPTEVFEALPEADREALKKAMTEVQEQLLKVLRSSMRLRKEHADRVRELNRAMTRLAVGHAIDDLQARYADLPKVAAYLGAVSADVIEHAEDFRPREDEAANAEAGDALARYEVNLVLDASASQHAPVVEADLPSHPNLVGRVDHTARFGMLVTDFRLIKGGLLHQANGGFLLIDALKLLTQPFAWQTLKRALQRGEIRIESMAELVGVIATVQLEPEAIPLKLQVVLVGDRHLCALLQAYDEEFDALFRVVADLGSDMPRGADTERALARSLAAQARQRGLLPATAGALARTLEHGARLAEDGTRLSAQVRPLLDLLHEADHVARGRAPGPEAARIEAADVQAAITARRARAGRIDERLRETTLRDIVMIATSGQRTGQVNALSVFEYNGERFGAPMRITATTRLGQGQVVDVQRDAALSGPLQAKGVMILSSFLAARYSRLQPHSITGSLVFEQTYGLVEGDSASLAELVALLSSIADVPLCQCLAVTGSVNQLGDVQAIGGINEKVEGFFDICAARGLDGSHGVVLPQANVAHLMLREDVIAAVAAGRFGLHAVATVDDALAVLTGLPAGSPDRPSNETVNGRIARRLQQFAQLQRGEPLAVRHRGRGAPRSAGDNHNGDKP